MTATHRILTDASLATTRKAYSAQQRYLCPVCHGSIAAGKPALDHDHKTGHCRAVLCQSCNVGEGKVKAGVLFRTPKGNLAYTNPVQWLRNLADYLEYHQANPSGLIHPTFDVRLGKQKPTKRRAS